MSIRRHKTSLQPLALSICIAVSMTTPLLAAEMETARDFPQRLYLGGSLAASTLEPDTRDTGFIQDDDSSTGATLTLGFDLSKRLSVEGFYSTLGEAGIADEASRDHAGEIDYSYGGVSAIGYLFNSRSGRDYPGYPDDEGYYRREGLSFFGRVGVGKLDTSSSTIIHRQRKDWDLHLGAGLEYGWSNGFAARIEFTSFDEDAKAFSIGLIKRFGRSHAPRNIIKAPAPVTAIIPAAPTLEPVPTPPTKLTLPTILFGFDQYDLSPVAKKKIDQVATELKAHQDIELRVLGHTDAEGSESYNQALGLKRANAAADALIERGIDAQRLERISHGEKHPVADNSTAAGRQLNRRVEFEVKEE